MEENNKIITTSEWIITKLIMFIPIVNIIMLIIWAFNNKTNINKSNWAKANLIIMIFRVIFYFIIVFVTALILVNFFGEFFKHNIHI
tara:strand:+ start:361 stop:621 length:261 start_codon:yes stop_codon:yes gene_type:complete